MKEMQIYYLRRIDKEKILDIDLEISNHEINVFSTRAPFNLWDNFVEYTDTLTRSLPTEDELINWFKINNLNPVLEYIPNTEEFIAELKLKAYLGDDILG